MVRSQLESDKLKKEFEQSHRNLPDVLARPGESWERTETVDVGGGQTLTFRKKYEYAGTEKKGDKTLDKITSKAIEVKYSMDPNAESPLKVTKSDLKVESSDGTILFDREAGCIVEAKGKTHIKGSMTFSIQGQELPGELDLTLDTTTQLQPERRNDMIARAGSHREATHAIRDRRPFARTPHRPIDRPAGVRAPLRFRRPLRGGIMIGNKGGRS